MVAIDAGGVNAGRSDTGMTGHDPPDAGRPQRPDAGVPLRPDAGVPPLFDAGNPPATDEPIPGLILRYDFSGEGTVVADLVGTAHAQLIGGATLAPNRDFVELDGIDDYVDMPNGIVSSLDSATFLAWMGWSGDPRRACWQRVFDFGVSDGGEDAVGSVVTSLFMTTSSCGTYAFGAMAEFGRIQYQVFDDEPLPAGYTFQVALVVDAEAQTVTLYRDRMAVGRAPAPYRLSELMDVNNWLGRSQWVQDGNLNGFFGDFRIYSRALSANEIVTLYDRGPNGL
jgi:hypothetical protein